MPSKSLREQKANRCAHFNGVQNGTCKAGIAYPTGKLPCLRDMGEHIDCPQRRWLTDEEIEESLRETEAAMQRMFAGLAAVAADAEHRGLKKGNGGRGEVGCPVCNSGTIHYSVASYNGHRHAKCTTDGCVSFIE
jgi:hypothetical protein